MTAILHKDRTEAELEITNILPKDELFFTAHNIKLSCEELNGNFIFYADYGAKTEDGEPDEAIAISFSGTKTCEDILHELREQVEKLLSGTKTANQP